jgi:hypothetical protein
MGIQLHEKYKENFDVSNESPRQNVEDEVLLLFFSWLYAKLSYHILALTSQDSLLIAVNAKLNLAD